MTDRTLTAMYDTRGAAETARDQLIGLGVSEDAMSIRGVGDGEMPASSTMAAEDQGFWASLSNLFMPDEDRATYAEGLRRGGYLLSAHVPDGLEDAAAGILEASEPIDLDQRSETWRQGGWTGDDAGIPADAPAKAAYGEGAGLAEAGTPFESETATDAAREAIKSRNTAMSADNEVIQAAEEELRVGGGRVRVRSYVTERPGR